MNNLLYVPNPLLRQKAEKIKSVGSDEKKIVTICFKIPIWFAANPTPGALCMTSIILFAILISSDPIELIFSAF